MKRGAKASPTQELSKDAVSHSARREVRVGYLIPIEGRSSFSPHAAYAATCCTLQGRRIPFHNSLAAEWKCIKIPSSSFDSFDMYDAAACAELDGQRQKLMNEYKHASADQPSIPSAPLPRYIQLCQTEFVT